MWVNRIFGERKRDDIPFVMQLNQLLTFQVDFTLACLFATRVKYPSHNDQFSLQTTPAETCSVGCHFITFNLHYLRLKLTFRLLYLKKKQKTYLCKSVKITITLLLCSFSQQNSNRLAVQVTLLCIALTEVSALFMWFSTKNGGNNYLYWGNLTYFCTSKVYFMVLHVSSFP